MDNAFLESILELTEDELKARQMFFEWEQTRHKIALDTNMLPVSRPQGYTIAIPNQIILEKNTFRPNQSVSMTLHPRYFTSVLHSHDFFEFVYVVEGHCRQLIDQEEFAMETGDMCILPPGVYHAPEAFGPKDLAVNIQIRRNTFWEMFQKLLVPGNAISDFFLRILEHERADHYLVFQMRDDEKMKSMVLEMLKESLQKQMYYSYVVEGKMMILFAELLRNHTKDAVVYSVKDNTENAAIVKIMQYIEEHLERVTLEELAEHFNYNQSHLSRLIKKYTGETFVKFRQKIRIQRAAVILEHTDFPVTSVAQQVGYHNMSDFYNSFRTVFLQTPQEYRVAKKRNKE